MHTILRHIRQNRIKIIGIILFIFFVYSIIHAADNSYKNMNKKDNQIEENEVVLQTDGTIKVTDKECKEIIEKFLKNCTKGNYEEAYSYLSSDCKEKKYPELQNFVNDYCESNKIKGKGYSINKVDNSKYKYKIIFNDMLSTGNANSKKTVEYFTITVDNRHDIRVDIN